MSTIRKRHSLALFSAILLLHLVVLFVIFIVDEPLQGINKSPRNSTQLVFLSAMKPVLPPVIENRTQPKLDRHPKSATTPRTSAISITSNSPAVNSVPVIPQPITPETAAPTVLPLDRNVKQLTQQLERELRFEKQKEEAAKPPNQIAREYWEKQNRPYKDKWEELAHKIEKAGVPRDPQMETFKAPDGTQITKVGDRCYKAPDPGRTYLHQAEARRVICSR
nr:hypothetical protein [uncultured Undibacterium sp.]